MDGRGTRLSSIEMPHQYQCRFCKQTYKEVSEFIEHVKIHMNENDGAKELETQNEQKLGALMLQRSLDNRYP